MAKVHEFSIRKTNILVTCPHCGKQHHLGIALYDKDKRPHRGGNQKPYEKAEI
jgi:hypothetical protein